MREGRGEKGREKRKTNGFSFLVANRPLLVEDVDTSPGGVGVVDHAVDGGNTIFVDRVVYFGLKKKKKKEHESYFFFFGKDEKKDKGTIVEDHAGFKAVVITSRGRLDFRTHRTGRTFALGRGRTDLASHVDHGIMSHTGAGKPSRPLPTVFWKEGGKGEEEGEKQKAETKQ